MDATDPGPVSEIDMESFSDPVNHPSHYTQYLARSGFKSNEIEDLEKAAWYITREISRVKKLQEI